MHQRGSLITAQLTFPKQGRYRLIVRISIQREGQTLHVLASFEQTKSPFGHPQARSPKATLFVW